MNARLRFDDSVGDAFCTMGPQIRRWSFVPWPGAEQNADDGGRTACARISDMAVMRRTANEPCLVVVGVLQTSAGFCRSWKDAIRFLFAAIDRRQTGWGRQDQFLFDRG